MSKKKLALIFGGRSGEHEISIISARSVSTAVSAQKYDLLPIYITRDGKWLSESVSAKILKTDFEKLIKKPDELADMHKKIEQWAEKSRFKFDFSKVDVAFPVMHGTFGEDGTVQGFLEMLQIPFVGCGVLASSLTMDKAMSKIHFERAGLLLAPYVVATRNEWLSHPKKIISEAEKKLGYPMFVKPANMGSSVGISKAKSRKDLNEAMALACNYDRKIVIEAGVNARELEISVLGNENPMTSVVGEIVPCNEFYDYDAKYIKGTSELFIPARISTKVAKEISKMAIIAFQATNCEGMARVDFFMDKTSGKLYINEINTIPGFTSISMYPKMFAAAGISYAELVDRLLTLAFERFADIKKNKV
ncbi:MAG: D-alanine--D-alanine ligase family protein [Chloroherpetonaceae bacterium]|nr:D-alanine--D-alanine ligase family protein [Chloroherpetonaceae bacterium]